MSLLLTIIAFGVMILLHELGHLLAALACGVKIERFSIGFGSPIFSFRKRGIDFRVSWLPLGGYVKMSGENPEDQDGDPEGSFLNKRWWQKALIAISGPFANLLLGILLFMLAFAMPQKLEDQHPVINNVEGKFIDVFAPGDSLISINGKPVKGFYQGLSQFSDQQENRIQLLRGDQELTLSLSASDLDSLVRSIEPQALAIVGEVQTGMPAWRAGLKEGDRIVAVDSVMVYDWYQMREQIVGFAKNKVSLDVEREGKQFRRVMPLESDGSPGNQKIIGITQYMPIKYTEQLPLAQAFSLGFRGSFVFIDTYFKALVNLFKTPDQLKTSVRGPVSIVSMSNQIGKRGLGSLVLFFGSISLILMMMNLLPIPVLDGGHIFFSLLEGIIGKPIPLKIQGILQRIFFALLITLMIYVFYKDISALLMRMIYRA